MYLDYFGIDTMPFSLTPDTRFFCELPSHREAIEMTVAALSFGEGFIKVTGEVGLGKTMVCRLLLDRLKEFYTIAYVPNPTLTPAELHQHILEELASAAIQSNIKDSNQQSDLSKIQSHVISATQNNKPVLLIVDEAQGLSDETLEAVRLLTNLETEQQKLIQVLLIGQTELDEKLASHKFRQLRQRVTFSYQLRRLTESEIGIYLDHRLRMAGYKLPKPLFEKSAVKLLFKATGGVPRLVHVIAHKSLLVSFGLGHTTIKKNAVRRAIRDTESVDRTYAKSTFARLLQYISPIGA